MFDISGWEFITLAVLAMIIFGPDRLPKAAAEAGRFIKNVRGYVHNAKDDLTRELGPEFADVKISDFTPRGMLRKTFGPEDPFSDLRDDLNGLKDIPDFRTDLSEPMSMTKGNGRPKQTLAAGATPPFDTDAT